MLEIAKNAKIASIELSTLDSETKNFALKLVAKLIEENSQNIFEANKKDLEAAHKLLDNGEITKSTYNRLKLDENKLRDMIKGIYDVINLENPVNKIIWEKELDENMILKKISCPIGVLGIIFEARPDVISQISSLAIKSGNAVILKGGKEAINTNKTIFNIINNALNSIDSFPKNVINQIYTREDVAKMLDMNKYIDLIIPRGGNNLVRFIKENTKIPVLGHSDGICHIFVDESAKKITTEKICIDSKTQYPSACNSVETILVHKNFPYLKDLINILKENDVVVKGDETCFTIDNSIQKTSEQDWSTEYGEKIVSIKVVDDVDSAIKHINNYGSHHTDAIITENEKNAQLFTTLTDSAGVYVNASTRFADGFRYGFGAEVGISTNKTHARGPVGLDGLTIYKYVLFGNGNIVKDYVDGVKTFHHKFI